MTAFIKDDETELAPLLDETNEGDHRVIDVINDLCRMHGDVFEFFRQLISQAF